MRTKMKSLFAMAGIAALAMTGCVSDTEDDANTNGENGEENAESAGGSDEALVLGLVPSQDSLNWSKTVKSLPICWLKNSTATSKPTSPTTTPAW